MSGNRAETADQITILIASAITFASIASALAAATYMVTENTASILKILYFPMGIATVGLTIMWLVKLRSFQGLPLAELLFNPAALANGFIGESTAKAFGMSWSITVAALAAFLIGGVESAVDELPPGFFVYVMLAIMLGSYGASFFYEYLRADADKPDE
jgi:hypothetical protein